jgi:Integrase core domain
VTARSPSCTEAKQSRKPFDTRNNPTQKNKGELTHMDLWGKYDVTSIHGHRYYLLLVDDAMRYVTVFFLKGKNEAVQHVKNYLTHFHVRGISTHALRIDRRTEFVNKEMTEWCHAKGMDIEMTALYSPSQNGVAERMNCTLVELVRTMITASSLPEFLWEPAVAHAAYVRNRAYTTSIKTNMPYQGWFGMKPNVSHLREFGAPVWVLLQGQNIARKILPKSKRWAYVGYNDVSKSVIYYNAETRKILTSRNYVFLTPKASAPAEEIQITEDTPQREGEREERDTQEDPESSTKQKHKNPKQVPEDEPRKTRGV